MSLGEFDLIDRFFRRAKCDEHVTLGIGDDGAVLEPTAGHELVVVVDSLVEGVHFPHGFDPVALGWRSVAVNLSDIAAMGARPRWATLALTLPEAGEQWLDGFSRGLFEALDSAQTSLIGGDTTRGDACVVTVQVLGEVESGKALRRSGGRPGDLLFVSGHPGDAAAGLRRLEAGISDALADRFSRPTPRLSLGQQLRSLASSVIDVSDGLYADIAKLAAASGVAAELDIDLLPLSDELLSAYPDDAIALALGGGDDYELCFTAPEDRAQSVLALAEETDVAITRIGRITDGSGVSCERAGVRYEAPPAGFDHFSEAP